jgi:hypothetical protein
MTFKQIMFVNKSCLLVPWHKTMSLIFLIKHVFIISRKAPA